MKGVMLISRRSMIPHFSPMPATTRVVSANPYKMPGVSNTVLFLALKFRAVGWPLISRSSSAW